MTDKRELPELIQLMSEEAERMEEHFGGDKGIPPMLAEAGFDNDFAVMMGIVFTSEEIEAFMAGVCFERTLNAIRPWDTDAAQAAAKEQQ